ncbi:divalent-cation tolerance protein CutA [Rhodohalobacter halophilus]|uniref:divalent-cation tolerance protein CutA n=1 Tax=Rhodohalobacter halophilus TaxID=1812810 RepID=UPI00083FB104|nr:divalent-cation tolerance protein CutA [Rhodohalobacter halophilus]
MFRNLRVVYITTKDKQEAQIIGQKLVEEKLAACVNIMDGMESIYRWKDEVVSEKETILIAKTSYSNVSPLTKRVKELHSYEVPCVITFNISEQEGNSDYLDWLVNSVRPPLTSEEKLKNS